MSVCVEMSFVIPSYHLMRWHHWWHHLRGTLRKPSSNPLVKLNIPPFSPSTMLLRSWFSFAAHEALCLAGMDPDHRRGGWSSLHTQCLSMEQPELVGEISGTCCLHRQNFSSSCVKYAAQQILPPAPRVRLKWKQYSTRALTRRADRLMAIAGVA